MKQKLLWTLLLVAMLATGQPTMAQRLPATAVLADENETMAVYLNEDVAGNEEEFELPQVSVWVVDKQTKQPRRLFQCNPKADYDISRLSRISAGNIPYVDFVRIFPLADQPKIVVTGTLPDYHNLSTSIVDVATGRAVMLPCNNGFVGFDPEEGNLLVASYAYYAEGGRYAVIYAYDENGRRIGSMPLKTR